MPSHADINKLIDLIAPAVGGLVAGGDGHGAAFWGGYQQQHQQIAQERLRQEQEQQRKNVAGSEYMIHAAEQLNSINDPVQFAQMADLLDLAGHKAGYVKPGEIKAHAQFPQSKVAAARLKEIDDQLSTLEKNGYDVDQLADSHSLLKLKDGSTVPITTALDMTRRRPTDASGAPVAKPKKPTDAISLQRETVSVGGKPTFANFNPKDGKYYDLQGAPILNAEPVAPKEPVVKPPDRSFVESQLDDLIAMWTETHGGKAPSAADRVLLRQQAQKQIGTADNIPRADTPANGSVGLLTPDGIEYAATQYRITGRMPALGNGGQAAKSAILSAAAAQAKALGNSPAVSIQKQASYKADSTALNKMRTMSSSAEAFENKALSQADIVEQLSQSVPRTNYPILNDGLLAAKARIAGDTNTQLLYNALTTFTAEYAKIMEGSTGSAAGSSDSARAAANKLISAGLSKGTLAATIALMKREMRLTIQGYDATIADIEGRLSGTPPAAGAGVEVWIRDASGKLVRQP